MEKDRNFRAEITRDGLVDYYTGLGKALSASDKIDEGAAAAYRACFQYTPGWSVPMANVLALEARRFAAFAEGNDALLRMQGDINLLRNNARVILGALKNQDEDKKFLRESWLMFSLALAQAWGRAGNMKEMETIVRDLQGTREFDGRLEPYLLDAQIRTELALKDDPSAVTQDQTVTKATAAYTELISKLPSDDANKERRAVAQNNAGWTLAWRGGFANNEGQYTQAQQRLTESLRLFPDDYVYNRNMAVLLKRYRKPPSDPKPYLDKCRAAVDKNKDLADDFDKVQKYIDGK